MMMFIKYYFFLYYTL